MNEPSTPNEPKRYSEMSEEERIKEADRVAVFEWLEEQTKGSSKNRKKQQIENYKKALDELLSRFLPKRKTNRTNTK